MNQLENLQHTFQNYVLKPDSLETSSWVSAEGRVAPEVQLSKYCFAYHARLTEVLTNDFPSVLVAIGEDYFNELTTSYIENHPSKFFSLRDFGAGFANFINTLIQKNSTWQQMPWLYELAVFEWSLGQAFDAADDSLFTEQDMATVAPESWPELKFNLHSSVQRLNFEWNIIEMWQALTAETPTEITATKGESSPWLVWRESLSTHFRSMEADEQIAFDTLSQGGDFTDICESLAKIINEDEVPMHAAGLLKGWISQGFISSIHS